MDDYGDKLRRLRENQLMFPQARLYAAAEGLVLADVRYGMVFRLTRPERWTLQLSPAHQKWAWENMGPRPELARIPPPDETEWCLFDFVAACIAAEELGAFGESVRADVAGGP